MKVLVIGGGGREHALAWKVARSPRVHRVFVAPGNAGTAREPKVENVNLDAGDISGLVDFARARGVDLTIVGPEQPLVAGVVDSFQDAALRCFGPSREAAALEGSKAFAKAFMERHGIPTAAYREFTEADPALAYVRERGAPLVVKADGLAAGKGVVVARSTGEAEAAVRDMLQGQRFGEAGARVVIEDCLEGEEASFIVIADGRHALPLASSQDHKRVGEGDTGPNTGGMGAYSPAPVVSDAMHARIMAEVIEPAVAGMAADGDPFTGFLYAGLMIGADGVPRVLEFNVRCGDPETQPIMHRLTSDLIDLCEAALDGALDRAHARWDPRASLGVVMAAGGYPGTYRKDDPITGLDRVAPPAKVFHAGTADRDGAVVTSGGRVLCVCALGDDVASARELAYAEVKKIDWGDRYYRRDIGHRALDTKR